MLLWIQGAFFIAITLIKEVLQSGLFFSGSSYRTSGLLLCVSIYTHFMLVGIFFMISCVCYRLGDIPSTRLLSTS